MQLAITGENVVDYLYVDGVPRELGFADNYRIAVIITIPADSHVIAVAGHGTAFFGVSSSLL